MRPATRGDTMRRSRSLSAALVLGAVVLAGCSDVTATDDGSASASRASTTSSDPSPADPSSTSTSADPSSRRGSDGPSEEPSKEPDDPETHAPFLPRSRIEAAALHTTVLDRNAAASNEEQEVVDAWMDYWKAATDTLYFVHPSAQLRRVARHQALTSVVSYVDALKGRKQRVVGWAKDNVTSVEVNGDEAKVRDCTKNFTFSVDEEGEPVTRPVPFYDVTGTLAKDGARWVVTEAHLKELTTSCLS